MSYTTDSDLNEGRRKLAYERSAQPREYFARLRDQGRVEDAENPEQPMLLHRDDVEYALRNWQEFSSEFGGVMGSEEPIIPLNVDPPVHVKYRRLLDPYFSPRKMAALQPAVASHTNAIIDSFIERGSCDFSTEMAVPLPCSTFLSLLGLPLDELDALVRWKDIMIRPEHLVDDPDEALQLQATTAGEIYARFSAEIADRRAHPRDDLITHLTSCELDGEKLSESEILRTCFLLLAAGLDTVTISLECIFNYLLDNDDARRMLVDDPSSTDNLIEELLRWETPVQTVTRRATNDLQIGDYTIKKDQQVQVCLASANTDPNGLPEAAQVDVRRGDVRNFAFGGGNHRCLGSHLARMELRTVVRTWHDRIPEYRLAPGVDRIWNSSTLRGLDSLPIVWDV